MERLEEKIESLVVTAPLDGVYMQLPLGEMTGRHVDRGDLLGYVAPAEMASARVVVTQEDLDRIIEGVESVEVRLASEPWRQLPGELARAVPQAGFELPSPVLSTRGGGSFVTAPGEDLSLASGERVFEFELRLPETPADTRIGTRVHVRFDHGAEPLVAQWYRGIQQLLLRRLPG